MDDGMEREYRSFRKTVRGEGWGEDIMASYALEVADEFEFTPQELDDFTNSGKYGDDPEFPIYVDALRKKLEALKPNPGAEEEPC